MKKSLFCAIALLLLSIPVIAQDSRVTADDVDAVASRMFCPVCENEPLDTCYNTTCIQWKNEIGRQLSAGQTPEQVINYFIENYGQQVVGVPQDPLLRALSFAAPIIGGLAALVIALLTFVNWQHKRPQTQTTSTTVNADEDDSYRSRIERDLI